MGMAYWNLGQYERAMAFYRQALKVQKGIGNLEGEGNALTNMGNVYANLSQYEEALEFYHRALAIKKKIGDRRGEGTLLGNMGVVHWYQDQYEQALGFYQQALSIRREIEDRTGEGNDLTNVGNVYADLGQSQKALACYKQALKIRRELGDRAGEGNALNNMGALYRDLSQHQKALEFHRQALAINMEIGNQKEIWLSSYGTARSLEELEKFPEALKHYEIAVQTIESIRGSLRGEELKTGFLEHKLFVYQDLLKLLFRLHKKDETKGYDRKAFRYAERCKARSFLDQLAEAGAGIQKGVEPGLLTREQDLYGQLARARKNLRKNISEAERVHIRSQVKNLERQLEHLQWEIRDKNPSYAELKYPQPIGIQEIQNEILGDGEILLNYFLGKDELYIFAVHQTRFHALILPVGEKEINQRIARLLMPFRQINQARDDQFVETLNRLDLRLAHDLYQQLVQPAERHMKVGTDYNPAPTLLIVPDGALHYLPFEMLVTQGGEGPLHHASIGGKEKRFSLFSEYSRATYLIEKYPIVYAPSASVLKPEILYHARKRGEPSRTLLAMAPFSREMHGSGETLKSSPVAHEIFKGILVKPSEKIQVRVLSPLQFSGKEVQKIGILFKPRSLCLVGAKATETELRSRLKDYRYLHLSTHGLLDSERPMYSSIVFYDGLLQTYEIFNFETQADLVALSACETGLGQLKRGEGVVGLTRAFMYAGAPSLLVSLWSVSDESTAELMVEFYQHLQAGRNKGAALRQAKLALMGQRKETGYQDKYGNVIYMSYAHPFFWAPFVLLGDWR